MEKEKIEKLKRIEFLKQNFYNKFNNFLDKEVEKYDIKEILLFDLAYFLKEKLFEINKKENYYFFDKENLNELLDIYKEIVELDLNELIEIKDKLLIFEDRMFKSNKLTDNLIFKICEFISFKIVNSFFRIHRYKFTDNEEN